MKTTIIQLSIYLISVFLMWLYIKIAHSKGGVWEVLKPNFLDMFTCFCPVVNTVAAIFYWTVAFPINNKTADLSKFFLIKK